MTDETAEKELTLKPGVAFDASRPVEEQEIDTRMSVLVEGRGGEFPIIRLVPVTHDLGRPSHRGPLKGHEDRLGELLMTEATRCFRLGFSNRTSGSVGSSWHYSVQLPAADVEPVTAALTALLAGDAGPLDQFLSHPPTLRLHAPYSGPEQ